MTWLSYTSTFSRISDRRESRAKWERQGMCHGCLASTRIGESRASSGMFSSAARFNFSSRFGRTITRRGKAGISLFSQLIRDGISFATMESGRGKKVKRNPRTASCSHKNSRESVALHLQRVSLSSCETCGNFHNEKRHEYYWKNCICSCII